MRVALEARALSGGSGGVRTYVRELLRSLGQRRDLDMTVLVGDEVAGRRVGIGKSQVVPLRAWWQLPWWLQRRVPRVLAEVAPEVVHFTKSDMPSRKVAPTVVTVFDLIPWLFPEGQERWRRWYWPGAYRRVTRLADHIVTISEQTKRDLVRNFDVDPARVTVTQLAVDRERFVPDQADYVREARRQRLALPSRFVLYVGRREVRKNVAGLLRAFAYVANDVPHDLVIVGRRAERDDGTERVIADVGLGGRVHFIETVSDTDLPVVYGLASLFVWASVYEGWGFPPQEAMACGTPVVVSDGGSLPEVVGEAGVVVPFTVSDMAARLSDHDFERSLAAAMREVLGDEGRRAEMREAGLAWVQQFSWETVVERTIGVYEQVCGQSRT